MRILMKKNLAGILFFLAAVLILVVGNVNFPKRDEIHTASGRVLSFSRERAGRMNVSFIELDDGRSYYVPPNYKRMFSADTFQAEGTSDPVTIRYIDVTYAGAFRAVDIRNSEQVFLEEQAALQDYRELRSWIWIGAGFAFACSLISVGYDLYEEKRYGGFTNKKQRKRKTGD